MHALGSRVQDKITGTTGVVTARVEYLHSAPRIEVASEVDPKDARWVDEARYGVAPERHAAGFQAPPER